MLITDEGIDMSQVSAMPASGSSGSNQDPRLENIDDNFKVVVRVRPALPRERHTHGFCDVVRVEDNQIQIDEIVNDPSGNGRQLVADHAFTFDRVYGPHSSQVHWQWFTFFSKTIDLCNFWMVRTFGYLCVDQEDVYNLSAKPAVENAILGYNATILAYGQTSSGTSTITFLK